MNQSERNRIAWADPERKARLSASMKAAWADPERRARWAKSVTANARSPASIEKWHEYLGTPEGRKHLKKWRAARWNGHVKMTPKQKRLFEKLRKSGISYAEAKREAMKEQSP